MTLTEIKSYKQRRPTFSTKTVLITSNDTTRDNCHKKCHNPRSTCQRNYFLISVVITFQKLKLVIRGHKKQYTLSKERRKIYFDTHNFFTFIWHYPFLLFTFLFFWKTTKVHHFKTISPLSDVSIECQCVSCYPYSYFCVC